MQEPRYDQYGLEIQTSIGMKAIHNHNYKAKWLKGKKSLKECQKEQKGKYKMDELSQRILQS